MTASAEHRQASSLALIPKSCIVPVAVKNSCMVTAMQNHKSAQLLRTEDVSAALPGDE